MEVAAWSADVVALLVACDLEFFDERGDELESIIASNNNITLAEADGKEMTFPILKDERVWVPVIAEEDIVEVKGRWGCKTEKRKCEEIDKMYNKELELSVNLCICVCV